MLTTAATTVQHLWPTHLVVRRMELESVVRADPGVLHEGGGACTTLPLSALVGDDAALRAELLASMRLLHERATDAGLSPRPVVGVDLALEVWRSGYELPMLSSASDWIGWVILAATEPRHEESGTIAVYDPRAGSAMTAAPGLPWGRQLSVRPHAGLLAVIPGWMTSAVQPVEAGQTVAVVTARSTH